MSDVAVNKKLLSDFKINFENINKTSVNIAKELEKRAAFSEECAKILLNQEGNADFSFFVSAAENEKSKVNFSAVKKNIIEENLFLCEYIFKSINFSDMFSAYSAYIAINPAKFNRLDLSGKIGLEIYLTEKFSLNKFLQYMALFDFEIAEFDFNGADNSVVLALKMPNGTNVKDKENIFAVFCGLLEQFGIKEIFVENRE